MRPSFYLTPLLAVALPAAIQAVEQQRPLVQDVVITGTRSIHQDRVRFLLQTRAGQQFDPKAVADDLRAIETMGPFSGTRAELVFDPADRRRLTVVFHLVEQPFIVAVRFAGLNYFQRSGLEKQLTTRIASHLNPLLAENDRRALERHFQDKGYRNVRVTVEAPVDAEGLATVIFHVDLGREIEIGKIVYRGLPPKVHPRILNEGLINVPGRPYQPELIETDRGAVAVALQDLGYLDAVIAPVRQDAYDYVRPMEDRRRHGPKLAPDGFFDDRVVVGFDVETGALWKLGRVAFVGNTVASEEEMLTAFGLEPGHAFKRVDIDRAIERARRLISNQGYARAELQRDPRYDRDNQVVDLTFHVFEGDLYTLDRVDVHGNYQVKDAVLRRAMRIKPGELWNDDKIDQSKRQITRTGLFSNNPQSPLRLSPRFDDDRPGKVDLIVDVDEASTGELRFQVGYSSSFGVFGEASYTERNFDLWQALTLQGWRGAAHILELSGYASEERTSFGVSWTNPHVFDGPYSLSTSVNRTDSSTRDWDERRFSGSVAVGRNFLDNDLKLGVSYSYTDLKIDDVDIDAADDALDGEGNYHLNTVGLTQSYDRLDHPRVPTRGFRLSAYEGFTGEPLSASSEYFEYSLKGDLFIPLFTADLGGTCYFHLSERWQGLEPIGSSETVPFYERYYGGGPAPRHRGFEQNRLSPYAVNRNGFNARIGGTIDSVATGELSFPLQGTNDGLRLVLFGDYGQVFAEGESPDIGTFRTAVGFGVRFPVQLPVALDFAWLLDPQDNESDSQIHFSLGFFAF